MLASHCSPKPCAELKACVRAPSGYKLVGYDIASEELSLARILGEAHTGINGSSIMGAQILVGDKASGTDMHSANAKASGIGRDAAKQSLYSTLTA